jgi:hypothetical protein
MPPIGQTTLMVDHSQPLRISWTPEAGGDATVLLGFPNADGVCFCDAPDSAGVLAVDASLLSAVSGEISLARLTISSTSSGNAAIDLVGAVVNRGQIQVQ